MGSQPFAVKQRKTRRLLAMPTLEQAVGGFEDGVESGFDTGFSEPPSFDQMPLASDASFERFDTSNMTSDAASFASELGPSDGGSMGFMNASEPSSSDWTSGNETTSPLVRETSPLEPEPMVPTLDPDPMIPTLDPSPADNGYGGPFRDGEFIHDPRSLTPEQAQGLQDLIDTPGMHPWSVNQMREFLEDYRNGVDRIFPDHPNPFPHPYPTISDPDGNIG